MGERGIPTAIHYPMPLDRQPAYKDASRIVGGLDLSLQASRRVLSLPMHPYLKEEAQDAIVNTVAEAARGA